MVNVFDFGAAGDGQQDDTEALQHALEEGDGVLRLNKGTYRISKPIVLDTTKLGYAAVLGEGGTSRLVMTGPGPALKVIGNHQGTATPRTVKPDTWEKERFPNINGLEILGKHPDAVGIELFRTMQATVTQTLIRNCKHGLHLIERNRNFLLSSSHIYDNAEYGVFFDNCNLHQTIISGNHISYNKRAGIKSLNGDVHNLHITGNDIEYNNIPDEKRPGDEPLAADIWFEAPDGIISEVSIASNTIQATITPGGANVRITAKRTESPEAGRLIAITGNVIGSQTKAFELRHLQRVTITGNTIYDSDDLSIDARHVSGMSIGSNTIVWRGKDEDPPRDGILLEDCDNVALTGLAAERLCSGSEEDGGAVMLTRCRDSTISNCQILNSRHRGIELKDCQVVRVTGNTITDRRNVPTSVNAIRATGGVGYVVTDNVMGGSRGRSIEFRNCDAGMRDNVELKSIDGELRVSGR